MRLISSHMWILSHIHKVNICGECITTIWDTISWASTYKHKDNIIQSNKKWTKLRGKLLVSYRQNNRPQSSRLLGPCCLSLYVAKSHLIFTTFNSQAMGSPPHTLTCVYIHTHTYTHKHAATGFPIKNNQIQTNCSEEASFLVLLGFHFQVTFLKSEELSQKDLLVHTVFSTVTFYVPVLMHY